MTKLISGNESKYSLYHFEDIFCEINGFTDRQLRSDSFFHEMFSCDTKFFFTHW